MGRCNNQETYVYNEHKIENKFWKSLDMQDI